MHFICLQVVFYLMNYIYFLLWSQQIFFAKYPVQISPHDVQAASTRNLRNIIIQCILCVLLVYYLRWDSIFSSGNFGELKSLECNKFRQLIFIYFLIFLFLPVNVLDLSFLLYKVCLSLKCLDRTVLELPVLLLQSKICEWQMYLCL